MENFCEGSEDMKSSNIARAGDRKVEVKTVSPVPGRSEALPRERGPKDTAQRVFIWRSPGGLRAGGQWDSGLSSGPWGVPWGGPGQCADQELWVTHSPDLGF